MLLMLYNQLETTSNIWKNTINPLSFHRRNNILEVIQILSRLQSKSLLFSTISCLKAAIIHEGPNYSSVTELELIIYNCKYIKLHKVVVEVEIEL